MLPEPFPYQGTCRVNGNELVLAAIVSVALMITFLFSQILQNELYGFTLRAHAPGDVPGRLPFPECYPTGLFASRAKVYLTLTGLPSHLQRSANRYKLKPPTAFPRFQFNTSAPSGLSLQST
jgi:hypothetical protein